MLIFLCFWVFLEASSLLWAQSLSSSHNTVEQKQMISGDDVQAPYMVAGESLVGLLKNTVDFDLDGSRIVFHRGTGQLFVRQTARNHDVIEEILEDLRSYQPLQVMIEARIIEVDMFEGEDFGTTFDQLSLSLGQGAQLQGSSKLPTGQWGNQALLSSEELNLSFLSTGSDFSINATLKALEQRGMLQTLSSPKIICFNNQRANIRIETSTDYIASIDSTTISSTATTNVQLSTDIQTAVEGIVLDVTPSIQLDDHTIVLEIHPEVVELVSLDQIELRDGSQISTPKYVRRTADTTVTLVDGGTVVIGGLMRRTQEKARSQVPVLGEIPILGHFFSRDTTYDKKSNLLIFITAKVWEAGRSSLSM